MLHSYCDVDIEYQDIHGFLFIYLFLFICRVVSVSQLYGPAGAAFGARLHRPVGARHLLLDQRPLRLQLLAKTQLLLSARHLVRAATTARGFTPYSRPLYCTAEQKRAY